MPNGKLGDHPLTDLFVHKIEVYGKEADDLIRKIADLASRREVDEWWDKEISWDGNNKTALQKAKIKYNELFQRAKESGWEINE